MIKTVSTTTKPIRIRHWKTRPVCTRKQHDLSDPSSYRRRANGVRECLECHRERFPTSPLVKSLAEREKRNAARRPRRAKATVALPQPATATDAERPLLVRGWEAVQRMASLSTGLARLIV
jgi:hypothetical protein